MPKRKAIFFLRHYNDIDHIVPIIYKVLETSDIQASVVITSVSNLIEDFRLQFLQDKFPISIRWIGDYLDLSHRSLHRLKHWSESRSRRDPVRLAIRGWDKFVSPLQQLNEAAANRLLDLELEGINKAVLAFDWRNSEQHLSPIRSLIKAANRRGFPVIALPHGDSAYHNRMFYQKHIDYEFWSRFRNDSFDHIVVPNELTAKRYRPYLRNEQVHVLGSPRFNREWLNILETLVSPYTNGRVGERRRILLFLRNPIFPIFWEELGRTLSLVTQFDHLYLVVKHHTRQSMKSMRASIPFSKEPWARRDNIEFVSDEAHSSALIQWSDLILDLGTSVVSEAVMLNKSILALEHLHANISTLAHFIPQAATRCRDDLYDVLEQIGTEAGHPPALPEAERSRYIQDMIEYPNPAVLDRYLQLLTSLLV